MLRLMMLLNSRRARTAADLMHELGVSRRTLFRYLKALDEAGVPYIHEPGRGYRLAQGLFLPPVNLTVPEVLGLLMLGEQAAAQRRRPMHTAALSAINKLIATVPEPVRAACAATMDAVTINPGGEMTSDLELEHYSLLHDAIEEGKQCRAVYKSPVEPEAMELVLEPYALHFAARAWYVMGRTDVHGEVRTLKLVRIERLETTGRFFARPKRFRATSRLGRAWQLIPEGKVYSIELDFMPKVATNVAEVRWHPSQEQEMLTDGRCRVRFEVDGLTEIAWWLCGYADQVVIRKPRELRVRVKEMLERAVGNHA
jgi:predicted DNA-binding transcriptional regulator YafY